MNLTDTHKPGFNFFSRFQYPRWADTAFLEQHPPVSKLDEYETLLLNFEKDGTVEDAFAICWQQLEATCVDYDAQLDSLHRQLEIIEDILSEGIITDSQYSDAKSNIEESIWEVNSSWPQKQEHSILLLSNLVKQNRPDLPLDSNVLETQAIVYAHLAVALALRLERLDRGHTERFWELLEDALRVTKMPRTSSVSSWGNSLPTVMLTIETSMRLIGVLVYAYLFHKHFNDAKYGQALECLFEAISRSDDVDYNTNNVLGLDWQGPSILEWMNESSYDTPAIEAFGVGHHLVGLIVPIQKAADAFERIWNKNSIDTDWKAMSLMCWSIRFFCSKDYVPDDPDHYQVSSDLLLQRIDADHYWGMAELLVSQRMSPNELVEALRKAEERQIEDRLRLYFFGETWDNLPQKARAALISADREYENARGRRPIIFDHLRHAARAILVEALWQPYQEYRRNKATNEELKSLADLKRVS